MATTTTATMTVTTPAVSEVATTTTWADGPYPLIPSPLPNGQQSYKNERSKLHSAEIMAHDMSHLHNMLIRGLNAIWQQAPQITTTHDITDFRQFCILWSDHIHHHHDVEEQFFFPQVETLIGKPGFMDANVEQHRAFETGLDAFKLHCEHITPDTYSGATIRTMLDSFAPVFTTHLADEITTLLALREHDSAVLGKIWAKSGAYARSHGDNSVAMPYMVGTYDVDFEGGAVSEFNFPLPLLWINDWIFARKYADCWRFLPCDSRGHRRELVYGPPKA